MDAPTAILDIALVLFQALTILIFARPCAEYITLRRSLYKRGLPYTYKGTHLFAFIMYMIGCAGITFSGMGLIAALVTLSR
jgi:hypothetical protein